MKKIFSVLAASLLCIGTAKAVPSTTLTGTFNYVFGAGAAYNATNSSVVLTFGLTNDYYNNVFLPTLSSPTPTYLGIYGGADTSLTSFSYTIMNSGLLAIDGTYNIDPHQIPDNVSLVVADNFSMPNGIKFTFWDRTFTNNLYSAEFGYISLNGIDEQLYYQMSPSSGTVPEPSTYGLIGIGALGIAMAVRRKKTA
jgi:hypothetical protein